MQVYIKTAMASTASQARSIHSKRESRLQSAEQPGFGRGKLGITDYTAVSEPGQLQQLVRHAIG
jgi:hypothetical protein